MTWGRHKALVGYLLLMTAVILSIGLHSRSDDRQQRRFQHELCLKAGIVAENQKAVLVALVPVVRAARHAKAPELRLAARQQFPPLERALHRAQSYVCP